MQIVCYPDLRLSSVCRQVSDFGSSLHVLVDEMVSTMYENEGVGLAAPQVGSDLRVMVFEQSEKIRVLINPKITASSPEYEASKEGCLSLPDVTLDVLRSKWIDVCYYDLNAHPVFAHFEGVDSRVVQHEIDHLDGLTILSRVGLLARRSALKDFRAREGTYR